MYFGSVRTEGLLLSEAKSVSGSPVRASRSTDFQVAADCHVLAYQVGTALVRDNFHTQLTTPWPIEFAEENALPAS